MEDLTVVNSKKEVLSTLNEKLSQGYKESELSVLSKEKLHFDELHDSEVNLTATSGSFSDRIARILTGEDGESMVLSYYDIPDDDKERYKQAILDGKYIVATKKDDTSHKEVEDYNAAYIHEKPKGHYASESKGPKSWTDPGLTP